MKPTGYVLYENENIVSILTMHSENEKTGDMCQLWILNNNVDPVNAARIGADSVVCGNCKGRPVNDGFCYVILYQGPNNVFKTYKAGK